VVARGWHGAGTRNQQKDNIFSAADKHRHQMKQSIALFLLLLICLGSCSKKNGSTTGATIQGTLIDDNTQQPIAGAKVGIIPALTTTSIPGNIPDTTVSTTTDANGKFILQFDAIAVGGAKQYYQLTAETENATHFSALQVVSRERVAGRDTVVNLRRFQKLDAVLQLRDTGLAAAVMKHMNYDTYNIDHWLNTHDFIDDSGRIQTIAIKAKSKHSVRFEIHISKKGNPIDILDSAVFTQNGQVHEILY
jgi:hypothetical protein